jgi:hypothetical protein
MKYLIEEPSPVPIRISLGPRKSPQDPVFKTVSTTVHNADLKVVFRDKMNIYMQTSCFGGKFVLVSERKTR